MPKFAKHMVICGNQRGAGLRFLSDHRQPRGGSLVSLAGVQATVRANKAGCLEQCEHGPTVVVYPEAVWYGRVALSDAGEIVRSHIIGDQPIERLRIADDCLHSTTCAHRKKPSS